MSRITLSSPGRLPAILWVTGAALVLLIAIVEFVTKLPENWPYIIGYEYEWIAEALVQGEGFSFRGDHRWLFDYTDPNDRTDPDEYYATAWEEPIYPALLVAAFRLFGEHGRVAMVAVHLLCLLATLGLIYRLGRRLSGPAVGFAAVAVFVVGTPAIVTVNSDLVNSPIAALLVCVCALLTLWCLEHVSIRRALILGSAVGASALLQAAILIFAPLGALVLVLRTGLRKLRAWQAALAVVFAAALVISPWTLRNYMTFGQLVPVRTGVGFIANATNPALAATFDQDVAAAAAVEPPWSASGPVDAWYTLVQDKEKHHALYDYATAKLKDEITPQVYYDLNEVERDKRHLRSARNSILNEPITKAKLMLVKAYTFYLHKPGYFLPVHRAGAVAILAFVGVLVGFKDRRILILGLMIAVYSLPYIVTGPLHYRYRYPVDPLIAVLAGVAIVHVADWLWSRFATRRLVPRVG